MALKGFFNSIMFPSIFTLGIAELGPLTGEGSGIMIMAIVCASGCAQRLGPFEPVVDDVEIANRWQNKRVVNPDPVRQDSNQHRHHRAPPSDFKIASSFKTSLANARSGSATR
ncbi:MAG: hypothetical protein WB952_14220 [Terriglobales bacterium]